MRANRCTLVHLILIVCISNTTNVGRFNNPAVSLKGFRVASYLKVSTFKDAILHGGQVAY